LTHIVIIFSSWSTIYISNLFTTYFMPYFHCQVTSRAFFMTFFIFWWLPFCFFTFFWNRFYTSTHLSLEVIFTWFEWTTLNIMISSNKVAVWAFFHILCTSLRFIITNFTRTFWIMISSTRYLFVFARSTFFSWTRFKSFCPFPFRSFYTFASILISRCCLCLFIYSFTKEFTNISHILPIMRFAA
jgi:hypothetical protein